MFATFHHTILLYVVADARAQHQQAWSYCFAVEPVAARVPAVLRRAAHVRVGVSLHGQALPRFLATLLPEDLS